MNITRFNRGHRNCRFTVMITITRFIGIIMVSARLIRGIVIAVITIFTKFNRDYDGN